MQALKLIIEIAIDDDDTDAAQAKAIIAGMKPHENPALFIGDSEFAVLSASVTE